MSAGHEIGVSPVLVESPAADAGDPTTQAETSTREATAASQSQSDSASNIGQPSDASDAQRSCPQNSSAEPSELHQEPSSSSGCPASSSAVQDGGDRRGQGATCPGSDAEDASADGQLIPYGQGASQPADEPPKCPLGFGSDNTAKLGPMNCILCQALYFDAIRTQCAHAFCRICAGKSDLCAVCGGSAQPLLSDPDMQGTVDKYIDVHSENHKLTADGQVAPQDETKVLNPHAAKAAFFLQIGLRSLAGGNLPAASHRLNSCHASLIAQVDVKDLSGSNNLALQIGAVCGSQGDCAMRQGDAEGAIAKYLESMEHLKPAQQTPEVVHATSVTLNKMGDLQYMKQDLEGARALYQESLELRRDHSHSPGEKVDLAASHFKVGDVADAAKDAAAAKQHFEAAKKLLEPFSDESTSSSGAANDLSEPDRRKLNSLQLFLASL